MAGGPQGYCTWLGDVRLLLYDWEATELHYIAGGPLDHCPCLGGTMAGRQGALGYYPWFGAWPGNHGASENVRVSTGLLSMAEGPLGYCLWLGDAKLLYP
jgi:hypothetical protein